MFVQCFERFRQRKAEPDRFVGGEAFVPREIGPQRAGFVAANVNLAPAQMIIR